MVIIGMMSYPPESVKEQVKRFKEQPPLPTYITTRGPYISSELGVGIKTIAIYEFDESKSSEARGILGARYAKYFGIPGLTYSLNEWLEAKEALKTIGMG